MADAKSQATFRLLMVENKSPFDATVQFISRYNPPGSSIAREYLLGIISSGEQRLFEVQGVSNGEEVFLQVKSGGDGGNKWTATSSPTYVTYTSSSLGKIRYLVKGTKQEPELEFDGVVEDAIKTPLPPLADHREHSKQVENKPIPEVSPELKKKDHWMQCVVQNKTQFIIVHDPPAYFDSGRYDDPPTNIEPYENMVFTVCNRDWAPTGATGGAAFRIILDGVAEYPFALGWTHPLIGALKAGVTESTKPIDGYNIASEVGNSVQSTQKFSAIDEAGKEAKFSFEITASPGRRAWYVVNQIRVA